jgi:hypothetical protein
MKTSKILIGIAFLILLFLVITQMAGIIWSSKVLFKSVQPHEINYNSFDPYCLLVVKEQKTLGTQLKIKIINDKLYEAGGDYGCHMNYFDDYYSEYIKGEELKKAKVIWEDNGLILEVPMLIWTKNGNDFNKKYRLFIPKECFIGGR